jgi:hypothetical protein
MLPPTIKTAPTFEIVRPKPASTNGHDSGDLTGAFSFGLPPRYDVPVLSETATALLVAENDATALSTPIPPARAGDAAAGAGKAAAAGFDIKRGHFPLP